MGKTVRDFLAVAAAAALISFCVFSRLHAVHRDSIAAAAQSAFESRSGVATLAQQQDVSFWDILWGSDDARNSWPGPFYTDGRPMFALRRFGGQPALPPSTLQSGANGAAGELVVFSAANCR